MIKKIFTHSVLYAIGPQIPRVISLFILPLLTQYLTPADYGTAGIITSYVGSISGLKDLGALFLLVNYYYTKPLHWRLLWRRLYGVLQIWSVPYSLLIGVVLLVSLHHLLPLKTIILLAGLYSIQTIVFDFPVLLGSRYSQLAQQPMRIAVITAIAGLTSILMNFLTIVVFKLGFMGWFISTFVGSLVSFLLYAYFIFFRLKLFPIFRISKKYIRNLLVISLPTVPHSYASYLLNSSDRFILDRLHVNISKIGLYNLAYSMGSYIDIIGTAIGMAVGPIYSKYYALNNDRSSINVRNLTFALQILFLSGAFIMALWLKEIFDLLISNDALKVAYPLSVIVVMGFSYRPMYWSNINLLLFHKRTKSLWRLSFFAGVINIILNLILIPFFGIWAAAVNTFICFMYIGYSGGFFSDLKILGRKSYYEGWWLILTIGATGIVFFLRDESILIKASITAFTLVVCYLLSSRLYKRIDPV